MGTLNRILKEKIASGVFYYRTLSKTASLPKRACRILAYHAIEESDPSKDRMGLAVHPEIFHQHMGYLKKNNFHVLGLLDFVKRITDKTLVVPDKSIVITFDDGYKSVAKYAFPILEEFNLTATVFVNTCFIEKKLDEDGYWKYWETLDWEDVKYLCERGILIGSHGLSHRRLTGIRGNDLSEELVRSKELIEKNVKGKVCAFSYPHGSFNKRVIDILRNNGFLCACSSIEGANTSDSNPFKLKRTEITAFDNTPLKFEKKISGCYDWVGRIRWNTAG